LRPLRSLLLALVLPGLLFCAVASAERGLCLTAYAWEPGVGYRPELSECGPGEQASIVAAAGFYARATVGLFTGRSGRSREDASRSLGSLLIKRGGRSLAILAVATLLLGLAVLASAGGRRLTSQLARLDWLRRPLGTLRSLGPLAPPGGLPLPLGGLVVFALVIRLAPAGSVLDYDRAGILWAGVALALADGVAAVLVGGLRHTLNVERAQPYSEALNLWGADPGPANRDVSRRVRAAQIRGGVLALVGGLLVVEGVFGVNGLGETLKDIVVDRRGLDPLLLSAVLLVFSLALLAVEWLPLERVLGSRP